MASPGIAIAASASARGPPATSARMPRFYWDFAEARDWAAKGQTPWTPAISRAVRPARRRPAPPRRGPRADVGAPRGHRRGVAAGLEASGCGWWQRRSIGPPRSPPPGCRTASSGAPFNAAMRAHGLVIAGGQGKWAGKILRFGHMGEVGIDEMAEALQIMGDTPPVFGHTADAPAAVRAGREAFDARPRHSVTARRIVRPPRRHRLEPRGPLPGPPRPAAVRRRRREAAMLGARLAADEELRPGRIVPRPASRAPRTPPAAIGDVRAASRSSWTRG